MRMSGKPPAPTPITGSGAVNLLMGGDGNDVISGRRRDDAIMSNPANTIDGRWR